MSTPEVIADLPNAEYHARREWSQSEFKLLPDHPELFHGFHVEHQWIVKETDAMKLGTQLHAVLLEGEELLIIPSDALTANGQRRGKNWQAWLDDHPGNPGMLPKDAERIRAMIDGCRAEPLVRSLCEAEGEVEQSIFWADEETELPLRARLDKLIRNGDGFRVIDLKSTNIDVTSSREVGAKMYAMKYHQQAAHYLDAARLVHGDTPADFVFVFVRNQPPYNARAWTLGEQDIELGRRHNRLALIDLMERLEADDWVGSRFGDMNTASLPQYAYTDDPLGLPPQEFAEFAAYSDDTT